MVLQQIADPVSCTRPCEFLSGKSCAHPPFSSCAAPSITIVSKNNTAAKSTEIRVLYVGMRVHKNYRHKQANTQNSSTQKHSY